MRDYLIPLVATVTGALIAACTAIYISNTKDNTVKEGSRLTTAGPCSPNLTGNTGNISVNCSDTTKTIAVLETFTKQIEKISFTLKNNKKADISLSLDTLLYFEDKYGKMNLLNSGTQLTSGDAYSIYINSSDTVYLYVYQMDANANIFKLFPSSDPLSERNPISSKKDIWIPTNQKLLVLDETTGMEHIYIFASLKKILEFEGSTTVDIGKFNQIKKMGVAYTRVKRNLEQVSLSKQARLVSQMKKKAKSEGVLAYEISFMHK